MKYRYASDCHTHSDCSFDGESPMEALCCRAEELGLYYYTVSDHCECNKYEFAKGHETGYREVAKKSWEQMAGCAARHPHLRFLKGIELGQPLQGPEAAEDALRGRDYDFVIGSLHNVRGVRDFYHLGRETPEQEDWDGLFTAYFREVGEMVRWGGFDSLAHITYPLRYCPRRFTFTSHREELEEALFQLAQAGKALELNTSRLLDPSCAHIPDLEILKLFRRLGGRLVTLGSDAHSTARLGSGLDEGMELLREAGFREFAVFVKREPVLLPLEPAGQAG